MIDRLRGWPLFFWSLLMQPVCWLRGHKIGRIMTLYSVPFVADQWLSWQGCTRCRRPTEERKYFE